jgi:hypothetical protein
MYRLKEAEVILFLDISEPNFERRKKSIILAKF